MDVPTNMSESLDSRLPEEIQNRLRVTLEEHNDWFPAVAIAIVDQHGLLHADAAGWVGDVEASPERTIFPAASISKTIVAALCLQCIERGELAMDEDINIFMPDRCGVRNPSFPDTAITARHLLTHRSSLADDESALRPGIWRTEGADCNVPLADYVYRKFNSESESFEPWLWSDSRPGDAPWHYSNACFAILGLALETVSGYGPGGLDKLARDRLFFPLGMSRSGFFLGTLRELSDAEIAIPHSHGVGESPRPYGVCEYPAASLKSSVTDLAKWAGALLAGLGGEATVLSKDSLSQFLPPGEKCIGGLAWWGLDAYYGSKNGRSWEHGGYMDGVRSHIYLWPHLRLGAVILANGEGRYSKLEFEIKAALARHADCQLNQLT